MKIILLTTLLIILSIFEVGICNGASASNKIYIVNISNDNRTKIYLEIIIGADNLYLIQFVNVMPDGISINEPLSFGEYSKFQDTIFLIDEIYNYNIKAIEKKIDSGSSQNSIKLFCQRDFYDGIEAFSSNYSIGASSILEYTDLLKNIKSFKNYYFANTKKFDSIAIQVPNAKLSKTDFLCLQRKLVLNNNGKYIYFVMNKVFSKGMWRKYQNELYLEDEETGYNYRLRIVGPNMIFAIDLPFALGLTLE